MDTFFCEMVPRCVRGSSLSGERGLSGPLLRIKLEMASVASQLSTRTVPFHLQTKRNFARKPTSPSNRQANSPFTSMLGAGVEAP